MSLHVTKEGFSNRLDLVAMINGEVPADVAIKNGSLVNVLSGEILDRGIAIKSGRVGAVAKNVDQFVGDSTQVIDADGLYLTPGFIDAHLHIESSMLSPVRFAELMAGKGVTTIFYDPHEIANVAGLEGVRSMYEEVNKTPINGFLTVPSCVPASSPELETTGDKFGLEEIVEALGWDKTGALGEMMNFPGVLQGDEDVIEKLKKALEFNLPVEGHASGLSGTDLDGYGSMGIDSDHESVTKEEGIERARKGFWTYIREGSGWADLAEVVRALTETDISPRRFCLVTDDRDVLDLIEEGGVDHVIRRGIEEGLDPLQAITMASLNPAQRFGLDAELGSISPGRKADINLIHDPKTVELETTLLGGKPVDEIEWPESTLSSLTDTVRVSREITPELFQMSEEEKDVGIRVHSNDVVTEMLDLSDPETNLNSLDRCAVIERHKMSGNVGRAFVAGFDLEGGAIASTVAHDSHNLVVLGENELDMCAAASHLVSIGGGQTVARGGEIIASVELPIAGLMDDSSPEEVASSLSAVKNAINDIGCSIPQPMMILSSLALAVIPEVRLTDRGLVDVNRQKLIH
ncbi:MAG: adenine deaminase [Candidatus Bipolaricaulota bacterium]